jgi:hypothetical protein
VLDASIRCLAAYLQYSLSAVRKKLPWVQPERHVTRLSSTFFVFVVGCLSCGTLVLVPGGLVCWMHFGLLADQPTTAVVHWSHFRALIKARSSGQTAKFIFLLACGQWLVEHMNTKDEEPKPQKVSNYIMSSGDTEISQSNENFVGT